MATVVLVLTDDTLFLFSLQIDTPEDYIKLFLRDMKSPVSESTGAPRECFATIKTSITRACGSEERLKVTTRLMYHSHQNITTDMIIALVEELGYPNVSSPMIYSYCLVMWDDISIITDHAGQGRVRSVYLSVCFPEPAFTNDLLEKLESYNLCNLTTTTSSIRLCSMHKLVKRAAVRMSNPGESPTT